jgi:molybdate transport system substrate-binding protein
MTHPTSLKFISSMATRQVLFDLALSYEKATGVQLNVEAAGGVDAAKRVAAGEGFDGVVLAADAIDKLIAAGHIHAGSRVDLVRSGVSAAVPAGQAWPDLSTVTAVRQAVLAAPTLCYSTGPSGVALVALFERWGIWAQMQSQPGKLVLAPAGVPVGSLVAKGQAVLGFQQLSELINTPGIEVVGALPEEIQIDTVFSAGLPVGVTLDSARAQAVRDAIAFINHADAVAVKVRNGLSAV